MAKSSSKASAKALPPVTIVIEWENAIDVEDKWTGVAMAALEREIAEVGPRMTQKPRIMYLYNKETVDPEIIDRTLASVAPRLRDTAEVEVIPTDGLTYYKLKNYGISRATTDLSIMLDSDAAPQPGWLENLLLPFADPEIMAVAGFTYLGHEDLLSRTMALSWIFDLPDEGKRTEKRHKMHPNNAAVRTDFFRDNPFPDLPAFKKQCGFWLRDITERGYGFVRTEGAQTIHAPHSGFRFVVWRAWTKGTDRDYQLFQTKARSRLGRIAHASAYSGGHLATAWWRILTKGEKVDLPVWQRPAAMAIALGFYGITLAGALTSALTRSFEPLPKSQKRRAKPRARKAITA
jgi:Glycosyl transferase family 2